MKILIYNELNPETISKFQKIRALLEADDLVTIAVKKVGKNLYQTPLDQHHYLLFAIYHFAGALYAFLLDCVKSATPDNSRFLTLNTILNDNQITTIRNLEEIQAESLTYINPHLPTFNLLDKIISFDDSQQQIYLLQPPLIIIGSAGSGKTILTLEKMKEAIGDILYVTRSPYLVHNSRRLYYSSNYFNEQQQIDFLSFDEYLASIRVPQSKEMSFADFSQWVSRYLTTGRLKDAHQLFEEFKGVLTGPAIDEPYLSREHYLQLGIKQSIFLPEDRASVYDLFVKYLNYMKEKGYYDSNILSFEYLQEVKPQYDWVIVDEVQDLTNIQLQLILKSLYQPHHFILCGDSNQIVHPNFFSWSQIKTLFYRQKDNLPTTDLIRVLNTNYRNSWTVTAAANNLLKMKHARFGSVDKESNYLVNSQANSSGQVVLLPDNNQVRQELNQKTHQSTHFAVIVLHTEQKAIAKQYFKTPLIFSIQEAKGLEYENIILYNFTSTEKQRFHEITKGVTQADLAGELSYARAKDKSDKSLEIYKFYINALYVAITRAVTNVYWVEESSKQYLFNLLGLSVSEELTLEAQQSAQEEWWQEAQKLELQGKQEQAAEIRTQILKQKPVPWEVITREKFVELRNKALGDKDKKAQLTFFEHTLVYHDQTALDLLIKNQFSPALNLDKGIKLLRKKYYLPYEFKKPDAVLHQIQKYGVDFRDPFNQTPLMIATRFGNLPLIKQLIDKGANSQLVDNLGLNAFQIALEQALLDPQYLVNKLPLIYEQLEPDSIVIQADNRLIKLDNHLMEFLILNLMIVIFRREQLENIRHTFTDQFILQSKTLVEMLTPFPNQIVPERRKKQAYLSSILSKNEISKDSKYNRKLFHRVQRGYYTINPELSLLVEGKWCSIHQAMI